MAGTVTEAHAKDGSKRVKKIKLDWLSNASGDATHTFDISGQLLRVTFKPDSGGTQPSLSYDVTVKDDEEYDVLAGLGADLSNVTTTSVIPVVTDGNAGNMAPMAVCGPLDLAVANAGNAKGGEIVLYYR